MRGGGKQKYDALSKPVATTESGPLKLRQMFRHTPILAHELEKASVRARTADTLLTPFQRAALAESAGLSPMTVPEKPQRLRELTILGVRAPAILAAGITGAQLVRGLGASVTDLASELGFDCLLFVASGRKLARQLVTELGETAMRTTFVASVDDAVAVAGSKLMDILKVTREHLLSLCAEDRDAARLVMECLAKPPGVFDYSDSDSDGCDG